MARKFEFSFSELQRHLPIQVCHIWIHGAMKTLCFCNLGTWLMNPSKLPLITEKPFLQSHLFSQNTRSQKIIWNALHPSVLRASFAPLFKESSLLLTQVEFYGPVIWLREDGGHWGSSEAATIAVNFPIWNGLRGHSVVPAIYQKPRKFTAKN